MITYPRNYPKIRKIAKERGIDPDTVTGPGKVAKIIKLLEAQDEIEALRKPPEPPIEPEPPEKDDDLPAPRRNPFPEPTIPHVTLHRIPNTVMRMNLEPMTAEQHDAVSYVLEKINLALRLRQKCSNASTDNFYDLCLRPAPGDPDEFCVRLRTRDARSTLKSCFRLDERFQILPPQGHYND